MPQGHRNCGAPGGARRSSEHRGQRTSDDSADCSAGLGWEACCSKKLWPTCISSTRPQGQRKRGAPGGGIKCLLQWGQPTTLLLFWPCCRRAPPPPPWGGEGPSPPLLFPAEPCDEWTTILPQLGHPIFTFAWTPLGIINCWLHAAQLTRRPCPFCWTDPAAPIVQVR